MPSSYLLSIPPESIAQHLRLLRQLEGKPFLWSVEKKEEIYEIFICCHDRPGLFSRLTGVLSLNNINILGAQIFTRPDRIALDIFQVNPPLDPLFEEETWEKVYEQLSKAIPGKLSLDYRLAQKKPGLVLSLGPRITAESQVADRQPRLGFLHHPGNLYPGPAGSALHHHQDPFGDGTQYLILPRSPPRWTRWWMCFM